MTPFRTARCVLAVALGNDGARALKPRPSTLSDGRAAREPRRTSPPPARNATGQSATSKLASTATSPSPATPPDERRAITPFYLLVLAAPPPPEQLKSSVSDLAPPVASAKSTGRARGGLWSGHHPAVDVAADRAQAAPNGLAQQDEPPPPAVASLPDVSAPHYLVRNGALRVRSSTSA